MTDLTVANTILEQLGGSKFLAMTGAKHLVGEDYALAFRINGRTLEGARVDRVRIVLDPSDTYDVQCFNTHNDGPRLVAASRDIYAENLVQTFERLTGLYVQL